jgi:hypothetical protein
MPVYQEAAADRVVDDLAQALQALRPKDDLAQALQDLGAGDDPVPPTRGKPGNVQRYSEAGKKAIARKGLTGPGTLGARCIKDINHANECGIIDGGTAEEMRSDARTNDPDKIAWVKEQLAAYWAAAEDFERENGCEQ